MRVGGGWRCDGPASRGCAASAPELSCDPPRLPTQHLEPSSFGAVVVVGSHGGFARRRSFSRTSRFRLAYRCYWISIARWRAHIEQLLGLRPRQAFSVVV